MKIIWPDAITAVSAESEVATYEDGNVLNSWPSAVWKAAATTEQDFTITVAEPDAVHIGYTNFGGTLAWTSYNGSSGVIGTGTLTASGRSGAYHYWLEPTVTTGIASIKFVFPAGSVAVTVGIIRAGTMTEFNNPEYGMSDALVDYSISAELNNGGRYTQNRTIGTAISGSVLTTRTGNIDPLIALARDIRAAGFSVMTIDSPAEILFVHFDGMPDAARDYPGYNRVSFALVEAI